MKNHFKKAATIIGISTGNSFIYRASFFMRLIVLAISLTAQFFFWKAAFINTNEIADYNFSSFFSYLIISNLIYELIQPNNVIVSNQIREGNLNHYLLLPYRFMSFIFWKLIGDRFSFLITTLLPILIGLLIAEFTGIIDLNLSFIGLIAFAYYIFGGISLHFLIDFGIGLLAFWFERSDFLFIIKEILFRILAGLWFPFQILPSALQKAFHWLPFQFLGYTPSMALLNPFAIHWINSLLLIGWISLFYFLNLTIWKIGIKKYEAFGA